jgi:ethanolaminephosphotransferase
MCDYLVALLPVTLAPNVITLIGFFCVLFCLLVMGLLFGLQAEGPVDGWFKCLTGVLFFIYTVCDNMDGKQARRCGTGNPMGMLVDHGLDAVSCIMAAILQPRFFQIGNGTVAFICFLMPTVPFYYCNFSEYYTGVLHLPAISGPDESELIFCILCFVSAYVGDDLLSDLKINLGFGEQRFSHVLAYFIVVFEISSILSHTYSSLSNAKNEPHFKSRFILDKFVK